MSDKAENVKSLHNFYGISKAILNKPNPKPFDFSGFRRVELFRIAVFSSKMWLQKCLLNYISFCGLKGYFNRKMFWSGFFIVQIPHWHILNNQEII